MSINDTLHERHKTHGSFVDNALYSQTLKKEIHNSPNYISMRNIQREALDVICAKIARIITGDPHELDHWHDIAGYATLVKNSLKDE